MSKTNIIFMHSHNTGRFVQPYGHAVPTPNLMRLAKEGVLFRQAFAAAPTCSPSRASFMTGVCPHTAGMLGLAHRGFGLADKERHIARVLQKQGYDSVLVGQEHTGKHMRSVEDGIGYSRVLHTQNGAAVDVAPAAVKFLEEKHDKPFFLSIGLHETHTPFPDADPENYDAEDERFCYPPEGLPDVPELRAETARYKRCARAMDDCWGQVLDALDRTGLAENTLVCCFTDHGLQFPMHMCNSTDRGLVVYLMMRGPKQGVGSELRGGKMVEEMVSLMDLVPTAYDAAGVDSPQWLHGKSVLPLVRGEVEKLHDELYGEVTYHAAYEPQRTIRTKRYRYIKRYDQRTKLVLPNSDDTPGKKFLMEHGWNEQPREQEMLYDLYMDPHEGNNIVNRPDMKEIADDLRGRMHRWQLQTEDPILKGPVRPLPGQQYNDANGQSCKEPPLVAPIADQEANV